uniref:Uncharacterized protein n=1 Tax=Knipowitschia caucasica TaxID=637954 RepID=A0AAV2MAA2_KNICA
MSFPLINRIAATDKDTLVVTQGKRSVRHFVREAEIVYRGPEKGKKTMSEACDKLVKFLAMAADIDFSGERWIRRMTGNKSPIFIGFNEVVKAKRRWFFVWTKPNCLMLKKSWRSTLKRTLTNHCLVKSP